MLSLISIPSNTYPTRKRGSVARKVQSQFYITKGRRINLVRFSRPNFSAIRLPVKRLMTTCVDAKSAKYRGNWDKIGQCGDNFIPKFEVIISSASSQLVISITVMCDVLAPKAMDRNVVHANVD
jgi:hypothetical protein